MLFFQKPNEAAIQKFLADQAGLNFTYKAIGATATVPPPGFVVDHTRIKLGEGDEVFKTAVLALKQWQQFRLAWLEATPQSTPIEEGQVVAILGKVMSLWWLNACRIIFVINDSGPVERFGFAYGTLPDHAGSGEERFLIERDLSDNSVWYDILAFSHPHQIVARIGYPILRYTQKQFGRESAASMRRIVTHR